MKKNRKRALLIVLLLAVAATLLSLLHCEREYGPFEPDTEAVIRSGAAFQKVLRRSANAESIREVAELELSAEDVEAILQVLQSRMNPLLERVPHNEKGFFFRLVRQERGVQLRFTRPVPGGFLYWGGTLAVEPAITPEKVLLTVTQARFGAWPLPRAWISARLNAEGKAFWESSKGKLFRAAVISLNVQPSGRWRVVYRPFLMKKLLILRFL